MWNKYDQDFFHRTNNRVESWHAALKLKLPNNPNICVELVSALKAEESNTQIVLAKQQEGYSPPPR